MGISNLHGKARILLGSIPPPPSTSQNVTVNNLLQNFALSTLRAAVEVNGRSQGQTLGSVSVGAPTTAIQRSVDPVVQNVNAGNLTVNLTHTVRTVSGLQLWYAQDVLKDGNFITQWSDLSGNNRHAVQATAARRPAADAWTMNGHTGLSFNKGTQQYLFHPYTGEVGTVFIVAYTEHAAEHRAFMGADSNQTSIGAYYLKNTATNNLVDFTLGNSANGGTSTYATHPPGNTLSIYTFEYDTSSKGMRVYASNTNAEGVTTFSGTRATTITTNGNPVVGAAWFNHGVVDHLQGFMYEVIWYTPKISAADYTKITDYLKQKYALT